jgi:hypothetical protein
MASVETSTADVMTSMDTMGSLDKLQTANMARLMGDNQRVLDQVNRRAEAFSRWETKKVLGEEMPKSEADEMQISIDSPITTTHHHQAPQQSSGLGKVLAGAAIAAGLLGIPAAGVIGYGVSQWAAKTDSKPIGNPNAQEDTSLDIGLGRFEDLLPADPK